MTALALLAMFLGLSAQENGPNSMIVYGRVTMDDGSTPPINSVLRFGLKAALPGVAEPTCWQ